MRLHFSYRGLPEDLRAMTVLLPCFALLDRAATRHVTVKCEACGAEEQLVEQKEDCARAQRIKVQSQIGALPLPDKG